MTIYDKLPLYDGPRKLARIEEVCEILPIEGADAIECARIQGWYVVVKKGEFSVGDPCVFIEIDTILPPHSAWEFLEKNNYRVRTIKLRGQLSQGLVLPVSILEQEPFDPELKCASFPGNPLGLPGGSLQMGQDLTRTLGVKSYDKEQVLVLNGGVRVQSGDSAGAFPSWVPKTDEPRIQGELGLLQELTGEPYTITEKLDGTSATYCLDLEGNFLCCSRNMARKDGDNVYWNMARKYNIEAFIREHPNTVIQGEIVGPGIQNNPMGLLETDFYVFNWVRSPEEYNPFSLEASTLTNHGFKLVPMCEYGKVFDYTLEKLLERARGTYANGNHREGIVVRSAYPKRVRGGHAGRLSFKVINNDYLLKEK